MSDIEAAKAIAEQHSKSIGLPIRTVMPPDWAYNAACKINNALQIGCTDRELNWLARTIWKAHR